VLTQAFNLGGLRNKELVDPTRVKIWMSRDQRLPGYASLDAESEEDPADSTCTPRKKIDLRLRLRRTRYDSLALAAIDPPAVHVK